MQGALYLLCHLSKGQCLNTSMLHITTLQQFGGKVGIERNTYSSRRNTYSQQSVNSSFLEELNTSKLLSRNIYSSRSNTYSSRRNTYSQQSVNSSYLEEFNTTILHFTYLYFNLSILHF